jgi:hypothetical protein
MTFILMDNFGSCSFFERRIHYVHFRDRALYGVSLEPLQVDPLLNEPIAINTTLLGYEVNT